MSECAVDNARGVAIRFYIVHPHKGTVVHQAKGLRGAGRQCRRRHVPVLCVANNGGDSAQNRDSFQ